jgi:RNA polymerase sporulation-specific sigma factor
MDDVILVEKAAAGDENAMETILQKYKPLVLARSGKFFLQGGNRDDLIQEGMIGLYKAVLSFDQSKKISFPHHSAICITSHLIDAVRKASRKKESLLTNSIDIDLIEEYNLPTADNLNISFLLESVHDPETTYINRENIEEIKEVILNKLTKLEREALELIAIGYSYEDAANILNRSIKSIDGAVQRGRRKIIAATKC